MSDKELTSISIYRRDLAEWGKYCTLVKKKSPEMFHAVMEELLKESK